MYYAVYRWNPITEEYDYFNSFNTYSEAVEERNRLEKVYGGKFSIFYEI